VESAKYAKKNWEKSLNSIAKNLRINKDIFFFKFQYLNGNFGTKNVHRTKRRKNKASNTLK